MKYIKLFEEFNENEPAVIVNELKELDKIYRYLFSYDDKLQNYEIDTTNITEDQGLNYWFNINFFELENDEPIYLWKIFINVTQDDYISPQDVKREEQEQEAETEAAPPVEGAEGMEEIPEEEEEEKPSTPNIENCYMKITKYDMDGNSLTTWADNVKVEDIIEVDWLLDKLKEVSKKTLKIPITQKDVDKTKKNIHQDFRDLDFH